VKNHAFSVSTILAATGEMENENNKGYDEQDMDESPGDMERKSTAPKQQKKDGDDQ